MHKTQTLSKWNDAQPRYSPSSPQCKTKGAELLSQTDQAIVAQCELFLAALTPHWAALKFADRPYNLRSFTAESIQKLRQNAQGNDAMILREWNTWVSDRARIRGENESRLFALVWHCSQLKRIATENPGPGIAELARTLPEIVAHGWKVRGWPDDAMGQRTWVHAALKDPKWSAPQ